MASTVVQAQDQERPNILVIWGDDVGTWNISAYHRGMMGGLDAEHRPHCRTRACCSWTTMPRRPARRGAPRSSRASTRSGSALSTVGLPGTPIGLQEEDPTLAEFLKPLGYATGQFGKNHLGDLDEHLPTNHGFDEFYGILYHLNAGEYVEQYDFPKDPEVAAQLAQRGVTHAWANADGTQRIEDKGPFGTERQRGLDEEVLQESTRFIRDAVAAGEPFFVWHNTTRMHYRTNLSPEYQDKSGYGLYADGMMEMDDDVGVLLDLLDELGVADNTMVMFRPTTAPPRTAGPTAATSRSAARRASAATKAASACRWRCGGQASSRRARRPASS